MTIQQLSDIADRKLLARIQARSAREGHEFKPKPWHRVVVARQDGKLIGYAVWQEWEGKAFIGSAVVLSACRRSGVYTALVKAITEEARRLRLKEVAAVVGENNEKSLAVHTRLLGDNCTRYFAKKVRAQ